MKNEDILSIVQELPLFISLKLKRIEQENSATTSNDNNLNQPNYNKIIPNMGLTREAHTGNLIITFQIDFPEKLDGDKINQLKEIL